MSRIETDGETGITVVSRTESPPPGVGKSFIYQLYNTLYYIIYLYIRIYIFSTYLFIYILYGLDKI